MLSTAYSLPFAFELPIGNVWDASRPVELVVHTSSALSPVDAQRLGMIVQSFWLLAGAGGLSGRAVAPWQSSFAAPSVYVHAQSVRFVFSPSVQDEQSTSCLLALLLSVHDEFPLQGARLMAAGSALVPIPFDGGMVEPYPGLWSPLPFAWEIDEESESESREVRIQFDGALSDVQVQGAQDMLWSWGKAAEWGAFALPPLDPRRSSCLASDPVEHYKGELTWGITKCRFHHAALDSLVSVCGAMDQRVAKIAELSVE